MRWGFRPLIATALVALAVSSGCGGEQAKRHEPARPQSRASADGTGTRDAVAPSTSGARTAPSRTPVRLRGDGDKIIGGIEVGPGGTTLRWTNRHPKPVFSLLTQDAIVVDAAFQAAGDAALPSGRYRLEVIASGQWTMSIPNAVRARGRAKG